MVGNKVVKLTVRLSGIGGSSAKNTLWFIVLERHLSETKLILEEYLHPYHIGEEEQRWTLSPNGKVSRIMTTPTELRERFEKALAS